MATGNKDKPPKAKPAWSKVPKGMKITNADYLALQRDAGKAPGQRSDATKAEIKAVAAHRGVGLKKAATIEQNRLKRGASIVGVKRELVKKEPKSGGAATGRATTSGGNTGTTTGGDMHRYGNGRKRRKVQPQKTNKAS